jgi:hypothetical protein
MLIDINYRVARFNSEKGEILRTWIKFGTKIITWTSPRYVKASGTKPIRREEKADFEFIFAPARFLNHVDFRHQLSTMPQNE